MAYQVEENDNHYRINNAKDLSIRRVAIIRFSGICHRVERSSDCT